MTLLRRLYARLRRALSKPPTGEVTERRGGRHAIRVPAQGQAYDFLVHTGFLWRTESMWPDEFRTWIDTVEPQVVQTVRRLATRVGRGFPPHEGTRFEDELNRHLDQLGCQFLLGSRQLTCRVRVRVGMDPEVIAALRPYWKRRIELETDHLLQQRRAEFIREVTAMWSTILDKMQHDPLTLPAASLIADDFAGVYQAMLEKKENSAKDLHAILRQAVEGRGIGGYEYASAFDAAMRSYLRSTGQVLEDDPEPA